MDSIAIIGQAGRTLEPNCWSATTQGVISYSVTRDLKTELTSTRTDAVYLVNNGTGSDFNHLRRGHGAPVRPRMKYLVECDIEVSRGTIHTVVIEFDDQGNRLADRKIPNGVAVEFTVGPKTANVLWCLRLAGKAKGTVDRLTIQELGIAATDAPCRLKLLDAAAIEVSPPPTHDDPVAGLRYEAGRLRMISAEIARHVAVFEAPPGGTSALAWGDHESLDRVRRVSAQRERLSRNLLREMAKSLPRSNGSHHYKPIDLSVGIITDEYMYNYYRNVFANTVYLSPETWDQSVNECPLDLVLYVTCWKGMAGEDWRGIKYRERPMEALADILDYANERGIPTAFQSIEDPSNYEHFLPIAEKFGYVFTTDEECVSRYIKDLGHQRVAFGEYGVNPLLNNPLGAFRHDIKQALFAGSYPERYPERCRDMSIVFDSLAKRANSLVIVDRNYDTPGFDFPAKYEPYILGPFSHDELQSVHKLFRYSLNFNSITQSPTMCAMRVYELQAQGKPLISNYARSVFNRFPDVRIITAETSGEEFFLESQYHDENRKAMKAVDRMMTDRTAYSVVSRMTAAMGLAVAESRSNDILVVGTGDEEALRSILQRQSHPRWTLCMKAEVSSLSELFTEDILDAFGYVAFMDSAYPYDVDYLESRLNCFKFVDADFVTQASRLKDQTHVEGPAHEYIGVCEDINVTLFTTAAGSLLSALAQGHRQLTGTGYATDPYRVGYADFAAQQEAATPAIGELSPILTVVVPVHNNGRFLAGKCFPSIMRNRRWRDFEVLLVDDGSTDEETIATCEEYASIYPNVAFHRFQDGGSGSASRPRNLGIELARSQLITFLDPDNEISPGGYDTLLDVFEESGGHHEGVEFVSGYQLKVGSGLVTTGQHADVRASVVTDFDRRFFSRGTFPVVSTQAAVISIELLRNKGIRFVQEAVGQDTLFGWELLFNAQKGVFTDAAHLVYYADRAGSVTNIVTVDYFRKCLTLERAQVKILKDAGQFDNYMREHFGNFVRNWYLRKLDSVPLDTRREARDVLRTIVSLYGEELSTIEGSTGSGLED